MKRKKFVVAIDGPAGVGKSSVGKNVASALGYKFISTGKMYRALAWKALEAGIDLKDEEELVNAAEAADWTFPEGEGPEADVALDGKVPGDALIQEKVSRASSVIAVLPRIRAFMKKMQRRAGENGGVVMEGRDIGTNVFPDAEIKIFLDASPEARAERRYKQLKSRNEPADYGEILGFIIERDKQDSTRALNPLKKAEDAYYLDSTGLDQKQVTERIVEVFNEVSTRLLSE